MNRRPKVIVIGAGFAGLWATRKLRKSGADVTLIDRNNYHTFLPLLYQVSTAELEPESIAYPVRKILRGIPSTRFQLGEVRDVDFERRTVATEEHEYEYDYLVVSLGSVTHFLDVPGAAAHAFSLKTLNEGIALRNHILRNFEKASHEDDAAERRKLLTFAVVGGGATGIEFAGALAELIHGPLREDFPNLDFKEVRVLIVEAADSLLPGMAGKVRFYAVNRLRDMGVDIELRAKVKEVTPDSVITEDGRNFPTKTVLWTAGVKGNPNAQLWGLPLDSNGRVPVLNTLQVQGYPNVYIVGDLAAVKADGHELPMIAPVAIQQGTRAAKNISLEIKGKAPVPFRYRDWGMMMTVGRGAAVAQLGGHTFTGFSAWVLWLGIHLVKLIGFRNRLMALINWSWDYFFYERVVRLILP